MMTLVGLGLLFVFGFFAIRHFRNGRYVFGAFATLGSVLGALSLWAGYQMAMGGAVQDAPRVAKSAPKGSNTSASKAPVFGEYKPESNGTD